MTNNSMDATEDLTIDAKFFIDDSEFSEEIFSPNQNDEKNFSERYSPKQIGSIAKYIEPVNGITTIDEVAEMFKANPSLQALPVEEYDRVVGIIERKTALEASNSIIKILTAGPVSNYILKDFIILNAKDYIEKSFAKISEVNKKYEVKFFPVFNKRNFFGIVSLNEFLERTSQIREQDLKKASAIQKSFFPTNEYLKGHSQFSIKIWNRMANSLGGDCFETFPLSDHDGLICCFDVSGKNVAASLLTIAAMCYFKMLKTDPHYTKDPVKILAGLDAYLENVVPVGNFITAAIVYVNVKKRVFYVFNCGHTTIFLIYKNPNDKNAKMKIATIEPKLPPFGMGQIKIDLENSEKITDIKQKPYYILSAKKGVHLALYSDGFTDMMNEYGERYEEENAKNFFADLYFKKPDEVPSTIEKTVDDYIGKAMLPDDITVIDVRFDTDLFC